ncbi:hypothetical protein E1176_19975 [Fulvivirga sp. RKSG066]|uniref:hypothetical protein n=1 Tax=Fulvivirga aurantia TaxID=2529383 RepID=UPI0012BB62BA|nr:hypothetical protein [Fulvivirga aurantia]MTI23317.1 hypothetical protein [Fulvivirga aurantia]
MVYFKEEQKFRQWWMWAIIIPSVALVIGLCINEIYELQVLNEFPGSPQLSPEWRLIILCAAMIITLALAYGIFVARLETQIKDGSIYYRFIPFVWQWKKIRKDEIDKLEVRKYNPIAEYGGWGYRFLFRNSKALNVRGNMGLQIYFTNGKKLLLGTQKPDQLAKTVDKFMNVK